MFEQERNKKIVQRFYQEIWNEGKFEVADEIFALDFRGESPGSPGTRGPAEVKQFIAMFRNAFPDFRIEINDQIAEGDIVGSRFVVSGTHRRPFMGIPPTNKPMRMMGMAMTRFRDGMIYADRGEFDMLGAFQQLGVIPSRPPGGGGPPG